VAKRKSIWVKPSGDVWIVVRENGGRASAIRNTQREAIQVARNIALNQNLDIIICGPNGRILKKVTPREAKDSECFLTTACVKYYQMDDNCYQLKTLRRFRDSYLANTEKGQYLIRQYYLIAPIIVSFLENDPNRDLVFKVLFMRINLACENIEARRYEQASKIYLETVIQISKKYKLYF